MEIYGLTHIPFLSAQGCRKMSQAASIWYSTTRNSGLRVELGLHICFWLWTTSVLVLHLLGVILVLRGLLCYQWIHGIAI